MNDKRRASLPEPDAAYYSNAAPFRPAAKDALYVRVIPVAGELPSYRAPSARRDLLAGLTVAALAQRLPWSRAGPAQDHLRDWRLRRCGDDDALASS